MKNISLDLSNKIDAGIVDLLSDLNSIAVHLGVRFFVIGATARDIILEQGFGISTRRKTQDVDLAVMVKDWNAFDKVKKELSSTGRFVQESNALEGKWDRLLLAIGPSDRSGFIFETYAQWSRAAAGCSGVETRSHRSW